MKAITFNEFVTERIKIGDKFDRVVGNWIKPEMTLKELIDIAKKAGVSTDAGKDWIERQYDITLIESAVNEESMEYKIGALARIIGETMDYIDSEMSYKDFAVAIAKVMKDDYGKHNFKPFIEELKKNLK